MSPREIELDESLKEYKKTEAEKSSEAGAKEQREFEAVRKEKKLKKPGAVSRFFNQFGIGKYWERLNDYYEQQEKLAEAEAEREAIRETAEDIRAVAETEVSSVKARGQEVPTKILESAARTGASPEEAAPVIEEAKAETAAIEREAEAAKTDLAKDLPPVEEFEIEARKAQEMRILSPEKVKTVEVLEEEVEEPVVEDLPPVEEFEAIAKEHKVRAEMEKAKVEPVPLKKPKKVKKELPSIEKEEFEAIPATEFLGEFGFKIGDKVVVVGDSGNLDTGWKITSLGKETGEVLLGKKDKGGEPIFLNVDIKTLKKWQAEAAEEAWFEKGAATSRARGKRIESKLGALREKGKKVRVARAKAAFKIAEPEVRAKKKSGVKKVKAA